ncbi:DUF1780 domain-containing protein [Pseudomonas sp. EGD-AK9]|uniref:DUF1780 domain-containing protein n=1 Tax=Pseudomonas sp. EGD-AK9 TaxID=1386078 RepID=UPI0015A74986|nr:DUF1780 domain-containing protein [Pseudomonas sp. EGD-AK9]
MNDEEFIAATIEAREESVSFFSAARKPERERWVVEEFLGNLGIEVPAGSVFSPSEEPPDVVFLDARFEVKEIMDPDKRRHAEYKESLRRAKEAKTVEELFETYTPRDITYTELCKLVQETIPKIRPYAPATQRELDLLFYVNLDEIHGYVSNEITESSLFQEYGWRSISFISGPLAVVLFACERAPSFLLSNLGKVVRREYGS